MTMKIVFLPTLVLFLTACAGVIQTASVSEAYKKYEHKDFERTLELITQAENVRATTPEMKAELTYLKALSNDRLGQPAIANTLYQYLVEHHGDSQYGYLASKKLDSRL